MKDKLDLDTTLQRLDRDAANHASVSADTEKVEAEIAHAAASWSVADYARYLLRGGQWTAGGRATKTW